MTEHLRTTRAEVLATLRRHQRAMTLAEIADQLDVHLNTIRFHIGHLVERGQVEQVATPSQGRGRPAMRVKAVVGMDPEGPRHYRMLAEVLTMGLSTGPHPSREARRAGQSWGNRLVAAQNPSSAPMDVLTGLLGDLGFAPEVLNTSEIGLRHCPFLELASSAREVVCAVHLGIMQGALHALDTDVEVTRLEPFVQPDLCVAHLRKERNVE